MRMLLAHIRRMAAYNRWANRRLYEACARLDAAHFHAPRRAFFGSLHGTLSHILVADRLWLGRIEGRPETLRLDDQPHPALAPLRAEREAVDARIVDLVAGLEEGALGGEITYTNQAGEPFRSTREAILLHLFNHQTHHRGQAHDQLSQTEVAPPPLDLMIFLREAGRA